jgi:tetratricopeptide (TPR) repeat protein
MWPRQRYVPRPEALNWYTRGVEAFRATNYEAARRSLEKAVELDGRFASAHAWLAVAYNELDASEKAKESMLHALSAARDEPLKDEDETRLKALQYVISESYDRSLPLLEQVLAQVPVAERAGAYVDLAWLAAKREDNAAVVPPLQQALRLDAGHSGGRLRLAIALDRLGQREAAEKEFKTAENLFLAASDYSGAVETLRQWAVALARANRTADAIELANRAMAVAASTGDVYHQIQLQLVQALAYRNTRELDRAKTLAARAVEAAVEHKMEATAANGLLDLGNCHVLAGDLAAAEQEYKRGLEVAGRARAMLAEARAKLALANVYVQFDRPEQALRHAEPAARFFRKAALKRESLQAALIQGAATEGVARFDDAERTFRDALSLADRLNDVEHSGLARLYVASVLEKKGLLPNAVDEQTRAIEMFGSMRGGLRAAFGFVGRARTFARMNEIDIASADLAETRSRLEKLGTQQQLQARVALVKAEMAAYKRNYELMVRFGRSAAALMPNADESLEATGPATGKSSLTLRADDLRFIDCRLNLQGDTTWQDRLSRTRPIGASRLHTMTLRY